MRILRLGAAFASAAIATLAASSAFYTNQVLARQTAIGLETTPAQQFEAYVLNFKGLAIGSVPSFGMVLTVALAIGFAVASILRRAVRPLAPIAYPLAGAASVIGLIYLIENVVIGGGVGAFGGARDAGGMALQAIAGFIGGLVFALVLGGEQNTRRR